MRKENIYKARIMVEIRAFKGVLYNQKKVALSRVIAPPYDVISPGEQDRFYKLDSRNAIRLIMGKRNRYKGAAGFYKKWLKDKIFLLDTIPSIYISRIDFREGKKKKTRIGFIALASLKGDNNRLLPHERTFAGPKRDRLKLLRACHANFSQIFTLYSDPRKYIIGLLKPFMNEKPYVRVRYKGEEHFLWKLSHRETINKIRKIMQKKDIFIADGHHRYEVARLFSHPFTMLYFSNMDEKGLSILPTHRVVRKGAIKKKRLKNLEKFFDVIPKKSITDAVNILKKNRQSFALLTKGQKDVKVFILKDRSFIRHFIKGRMSSTKKNLAATILDEGVLKGVLKIKNFEKNIFYTRDVEEATFLLSPVALDELKIIATMGERMPHKSTYFYPKLLSGLVIYDQERSL